MNNLLTEVTPFVYTNPQGLQLEVLFVLDPEKKGYINATAIAAIFDKQVAHWLRNNHVEGYIEELIKHMNKKHHDNSLIPFMYANSHTLTKSVSYDDIVFVVNGSPDTGGGTWLHPKLAVIFARWISPHFAIWCDELIAELLNQYPVQQRQFFELKPTFSQIFEQLADVKASQKQIEQRFEESINTIAQIFNNLHTKLAQDNKHSLGQIFNGINQLNKTLSQQQQADLLKPPVEVGIKQTLLDYQHSLEQMLQQMLHGQQDELIQNYLLAIKENLERIVQRVVTEPIPTITQPVTQPVIPPIAAADLVTEITALKAQGWSWQRIAQELNARGTVTVSGTGQWHGSSVKRYVESHIHN